MTTPRSLPEVDAWRVLVLRSLMAACALAAGCSPAGSQTPPTNVQPPQRTVKLVFIHHSCGQNWLADDHGGLGKALAANNYFVSDTNYGWGPNGIGDRTDITDWPEWFTGPQSGEYLQSLYRESEQHCEYTRGDTDPGGENQIIVFKSCFPNSNLEGRPTDAPARGEGLSVANAKAIYQELLKYFATRPDRLFVAITAPPVQDSTYAANARAFNTWLVQDWLAGYRGNNVAVFDFYNVLTGPSSHHRLRDGKVQYVHQAGKDTLHYPSDGDDHPCPAGNQKATEEFVPLLNVFYQRWVATQPKTPPPSASQPAAREEAKSDNEPMDGESAPSQPESVASAGTVIDDFEGELQNWTAFQDDEKHARLEYALDKKTKHNGSASLRIQCDLAAESWATCSRVYESPRDWSGAKGLSLYVRAQALDQPITIIAYGGKSADELFHFEYQFKASQVAEDGWQRIDIPWANLKPAPWQAEGMKQFDPRAAMGVAIGFQSTDSRRRAEVWIDDVSLVGEPSSK